MAYQFFVKNQQSRSSTSPPHHLAVSHNNRPCKPPATRPPQVVLPTTSYSSSPTRNDTNPPVGPYPQPISAGRPTPHPNITIEPVNTAHIASLTRITGLLLPIRYPSSFYTAIITEPVIASLSRVAVYHDYPSAATTTTAADKSPSGGTDKVIGAIRCRLEGHSLGEQWTNLYIQTLHLLSPYRGNGVATSLFDSLLFAQQGQVSDLVKHYHIRTVTAHVHEANEEALAWYRARGFDVQEGVIDGYYRRLKPSGAKLVKLIMHWWEDKEANEASRNEVDSSGQDGHSEQGVTVSDKDGDDDDDDDDWEKVGMEVEDR